MKIYFHKQFEKRFSQLDVKIKKQFKVRLKIFATNPFHPTLNNHTLKGPWLNYRSINITGDWRAIFKQLNSDSVEFATIDTHSNLYF